VSPVEYAGGKRSLLAYIEVYLQIHCYPSSSVLEITSKQSYLWRSYSAEL